MTEAAFKAEIIAAGEWLFDDLIAVHCPPRRARRICQAAGQRMAMVEPAAPAVWEVAARALKDYTMGRWENPGLELAASLLREFWGDPPDKAKALAWLLRFAPPQKQTGEKM